jgi:hypothetical protein
MKLVYRIRVLRNCFPPILYFEFIVDFILFYLVVLGFELQASHLLGSWSTTSPLPPALIGDFFERTPVLSVSYTYIQISPELLHSSSQYQSLIKT